MELKVVGYETGDGVATVTLNRPERLNAWTNRMATEFRWAVDSAAAAADVGAIVVTGAGRGFCPGADTQALEDLRDGRPYEFPAEPEARAAAGEVEAAAERDGGTRGPGPGEAPADFGHPFSFLLGLDKPIVAAVNGAAAGVGFVLMCFCDIRFAAAGAKITTSFARLGLPAEHGVSWLLPRLIGASRAADLLLSSRVVLAEEAAQMGLVNRVLPRDEVLPAARDYARVLANDMAPSSLRMIKSQLYRDLLSDLDGAATRSVDLMLGSFEGPDFAEGVRAWREKRPPRFR
jgi:enoyl-CoA hydratase/carnithine racemase